MRTEIDQFEKKYGYKPTAIPVAVDALAVFVPRTTRWRLTSAAAMRSSPRAARAASRRLVTWGVWGWTGRVGQKPISLYGRTLLRDLRLLKEHALFKGRLSRTPSRSKPAILVVQAWPRQVRHRIRRIGYLTADVRAVPIARMPSRPRRGHGGQRLRGRVSLARMLYVYTNLQAGQSARPLRREFVRYRLSRRASSGGQDGSSRSRPDLRERAQVARSGVQVPPNRCAEMY